MAGSTCCPPLRRRTPRREQRSLEEQGAIGRRPFGAPRARTRLARSGSSTILSLLPGHSCQTPLFTGSAVILHGEPSIDRCSQGSCAPDLITASTQSEPTTEPVSAIITYEG